MKIFLRGCFPFSASLLITIPSVVSDWLMLAPSLAQCGRPTHVEGGVQRGRFVL